MYLSTSSECMSELLIGTPISCDSLTPLEEQGKQNMLKVAQTKVFQPCCSRQ